MTDITYGKCVALIGCFLIKLSFIAASFSVRCLIKVVHMFLETGERNSECMTTFD